MISSFNQNIYIVGTRTLVFFFFGGVGNKWIKEFSLFCLGLFYVLLIKIQFLTFISDKKLNGYFLRCVLLDGHIVIRKM